MDTDAPLNDNLTFKNLFGWAAGLIRSPRESFRAMDREGGYLTPILYAMAWQFMAGVVWTLVSFIRPGAMPFPLWGKILWVVFGPGVALLAGFVVSGILFVIWHLMGSPFGYRTAFRVWAFMMPAAVFTAGLSLVPYANFAVLLYRFFLIVIATIEAQGIRSRLAWTVWSLLLGALLAAQILVAVFMAVRQRLLATGGAFPGPGPGAFAPQAGGMPEDQRKKMEEEMARVQAEFEKIQKENPAPPPPPVPPPPPETKK